MLLYEQLSGRYDVIAGRYRQALGLEPPPRPSDVEALAAVLRRMVGEINGYLEANAGTVARLGEIALEVTHSGDVIATVEGLDEKGKRARYSRFPLPADEMARVGVDLLREKAATEARKAWKIR